MEDVGWLLQSKQQTVFVANDKNLRPQSKNQDSGKLVSSNVSLGFPTATDSSDEIDGSIHNGAFWIGYDKTCQHLDPCHSVDWCLPGDKHSMSQIHIWVEEPFKVQDGPQRILLQQSMQNS